MVGSGVSLAFINGLVDASQKLQPANVQKVQWQKSLKAAQKLSIQQDKPMMIVFGASWCKFCHKLEKETLADKRIANSIATDFIPVHLDFDKESKVAKILEVERLPCIVFLTPQADLLLRAEGFADVKDFQTTLSNVLERRLEIQQVNAAAEKR
jgi:uncharacterized protein YyaL (SSP411 family)